MHTEILYKLRFWGQYKGTSFTQEWSCSSWSANIATCLSLTQSLVTPSLVVGPSWILFMTRSRMKCLFAKYMYRWLKSVSYVAYSSSRLKATLKGTLSMPASLMGLPFEGWDTMVSFCDSCDSFSKTCQFMVLRTMWDKVHAEKEWIGHWELCIQQLLGLSVNSLSLESWAMCLS